ncbi:UTRA domain-containing protein [Megamonas rupellensis]|uniref:UTRA domain-containing protein n=1 Tax=Megamonas rupellensis TaxID=491921 RepID=UPI00241DD81E|nr:UTRA domain-containing protein [Megamonas rupellensis]
MPTEEERKWLNITDEDFVPIFEVEQIAYLDDGRIFEYSKSRHRADFFELKVSVFVN